MKTMKNVDVLFKDNGTVMGIVPRESFEGQTNDFSGFGLGDWEYDDELEPCQENKGGGEESECKTDADCEEILPPPLPGWKRACVKNKDGNCICAYVPMEN
jgi:hypothetical protein